MKVIKSPTGIRIVPSVLLDAQSQARQIVDEACIRAAALVEQASHQAEAIRDEAQRVGEQVGRAEASALVARALAQCSEHAEQDARAIADLAAEVARTVLGREASTGPEVLQDVARRALARMRRARRIVLHVHPDDLSAARASCHEWLPAGLEPEVLDVEPDPTVALGGVVVESEIGRLDTRLDTQIEALRRALVKS